MAAAICLLLPALLWAQGFANSETLSLEIPGIFGVGAADIDRDGDMDIVATSSSTGLATWWENRGSSAPVLHSIWNGAPGLRGVAVGDFSGTGRPDVAVASYHLSQFVLLRNTGIAPDYFQQHVFCEPANGAYSISPGDFNHDGRIDLVTAEEAGNVIRIFRQDADSLRQVEALSVPSPYEARFVDLEGDGDLDIVACSYQHYLYKIEQTPGGWNLVSLGFGNDCRTVNAADLDGDGDGDIVAATFTGSQLSWWENTGSNFLQHPLAGIMWATMDIQIADLDMDGRLDIVADGFDGDFRWWRNNGDDSFGPRSIPAAVDAQYYKMTVTDFDVDGDPDLIIADGSRLDPALRLFRNTMGIPSFVSGVVRSHEDGLPVAGATVRLVETGAFAQTDARGAFYVTCAPDTYTVEMSKPCWNTLRIDGVEAHAADTTQLTAFLLHPECGLAVTSLNIMIQNHADQVFDIPLWNSGDGPLEVETSTTGNTTPVPWLSVSPQTATVMPGDSLTLSVRVRPDTSDRGNWDYYGSVRLRGNACPDTVISISVVAYVLDAPDQGAAAPLRTALLGAYPNPFNSTTTISFELDRMSDVEMNLFNVQGQQVRHSRSLEAAGRRTISFDARDLPSGVYLMGVKLGSQTFSQKLLLIR
jgi:hypothetical protein